MLTSHPQGSFVEAMVPAQTIHFTDGDTEVQPLKSVATVLASPGPHLGLSQALGMPVPTSFSLC
jgi:hypothetical protein